MANFAHAIMPGPVNRHRGAVSAGLIRDEHTHDPARGFAGGYFIELLGSKPASHSQMAGWGENARHWMEKYAYSAGVILVGEDPPQESNKITLHPSDKDVHDLPVPVLNYEYHPNT